MCSLMNWYYIHICFLDIFKTSYFSSIEACDKTKDPLNITSSSKTDDSSTNNANYLLNFS